MINIKKIKNIIAKNITNLDKDQAKIRKIDKGKLPKKHLLQDVDLLNVIDTPFMVLNNKNFVTYANRASQKIFKVYKNSNIFYIFRTPEFRNNVKSFLRSNKKKVKFIFEFFLIPNTRNYEISGYKMSNDQRLFIFNDVTRLNKLETLRSDFIGNVSHELKTPLSTIVNVIDLFINEKKISNEEKNNFLNILRLETTKMTSIINDLLDLTKIETDLTKKIKKKANFNKVINSSVRSMQTLAKKNGIKFKINVSKKATIFGDETQLQQLSKNILDNSIKYANKNSTVEISLKEDSKNYKLIFSDKGRGIPHALIPRITERFYRTPEVKIKNIEGTGLGLAIVKHIAMRHQATLEISSIINKGTQIKFIFKKKIKEH